MTSATSIVPCSTCGHRSAISTVVSILPAITIEYPDRGLDPPLSDTPSALTVFDFTRMLPGWVIASPRPSTQARHRALNLEIDALLGALRRPAAVIGENVAGHGHSPASLISNYEKWSNKYSNRSQAQAPERPQCNGSRSCSPAPAPVPGPGPGPGRGTRRAMTRRLALATR
jgi:hypothetical protein